MTQAPHPINLDMLVPGGNVSVSSIPISCPYARALLEEQRQKQQEPKNDGDGDAAVVTVQLPPAVAEEWKNCPAFTASSKNSSSTSSIDTATPNDGGNTSTTPSPSGASCPFKDAKSPEEISKTLSQIPPSHFGTTTRTSATGNDDKHAFMKALAYLHSSGHDVVLDTNHSSSYPKPTTPSNVISKVMAMTATEGGRDKSNASSSSSMTSPSSVVVTRCPVKPYLPKGWTFDQTLEEYSLASIMSKLAEQHEEEHQQGEGVDEENNNESQLSPSPPDYADNSSAGTNNLGNLMDLTDFGDATAAVGNDIDHNVNTTMKISIPTAIQRPNSSNTTGLSPSSGGQCRLSDALKTGTARAHEAAESVHFVKNFIRGKIDRQLYALLVAQLFHVYRRLEEALDEHAPAHFAGVHFPAELSRTQALREDVDFWHSDLKEGVEPTISPASQDYIDRIDYLVKTNPLLLLAHAYTRYLGDLSGGKILARVARRALRLDKLENGRSGEGLRFYDFDKIQSFKVFKDRYRQALNDLSLDEEQVEAIVEEANVAFLLNMRLFEELDVLGGVQGASVRSLEAVYEESKFNMNERQNETTLTTPTRAKSIPPECPFAKTSNTATIGSAEGQQLADDAALTRKKGICPWPFILLHDPKEGMKKWQTWAVIGLILSFVYHYYLNATTNDINDDKNIIEIVDGRNIESATGMDGSSNGKTRRILHKLLSAAQKAFSPSHTYSNWKR